MPSTQRGGALLDGIKSKFSGDSSYTNYTTDTGVNSGVLQYIYYFLAFTLLVVLLLVLIHFTIKPIFRTRPGAPGYISMPGSDDSEVFWKKINEIVTLQDIDTPLQSKFQNYSVIFDINIDNPTSNTDYPRILFTRGEMLPKPTQPYTDRDTILSIAPNFNLILYLDRLTNDLNIAVQTSMSSGAQSGAVQVLVENITIENLPVRKPIRIGIMVGNGVLEVYLNGYLARTKTFNNPMRAIMGPVQPPNDAILSSTARVRNLRMWGRPLSAAEFRAYNGPEAFDEKDMPDSCAA
jgi:hypothetical protein